jgi:general secretion pathway protein K
MMRCPRQKVNGEHGFALLIVLWALVLIGFLVAHITATGRTELQIASNLKANAVLQAAADGAIYQTIFNLSDPQLERRWRLDGEVHEIRIGRSQIAVRLEDEAGRLNPSLASPALVEALLRVLNADPDQAAALAAAIAEWVGAVPARPPSVALADYQAAGLDYGPPAAPLESVDELARVRGMTPQMLSTLRPHLTLFGPPEPDRADADPAVAAALALAGRAGPIAATAASDSMLVRIHAVAQGSSNGLVTRTAVVRIAPGLPNGHVPLAWSSDDD